MWGFIMSNDSLKKQAIDKIDEIINATNFENTYKVRAYGNDTFSVLNTLTNEKELDLECGYKSFTVALPDGQKAHFASNQWIHNLEYNKKELLFEETSEYEKMENAYGFLHHVVYPKKVSWWDKTSPDMRRIYDLWHNSNLRDDQDQERILGKIHQFIASPKFKQMYNVFNRGSGLYSVSYKDYKWFDINDCFNYYLEAEHGIIIEMACAEPMICKRKAGLYLLDTPYKRASNLYYFIASLAQNKR